MQSAFFSFYDRMRLSNLYSKTLSKPNHSGLITPVLPNKPVNFILTVV